ncbi:MAG TPA: hypothetical protein VH044_02030 [Polyangiaceae bacterium]|jgi:hypothetical protein|nr:hypothetical protein [Polyangiaceae bacterium]
MAIRWPMFDLKKAAGSQGSASWSWRASPIGVARYAACLALPCWVFWRLSIPMLATALGFDEQVFVWTGWSILKGLVPYKDFLEWKPPLAFLTHALALGLFGFGGYHFRYFFGLFAIASVCAVLASLLKRGCDAVICSALGLAMVYLFLYPGYHETYVSDTESIGLAYYYFGVAALIADTRRRPLAEIAGGVLFTCCVLSKEPFAPCVIATWAGCYFVVEPRPTRRGALRYLKYTTLGVGAAVALLSLYMVPTGAMSAYVALVRRYAAMFRDPQKGYCAVLGIFKPTGRFWDDLPAQWDRIHDQFANPTVLACLAPFFAATFVFAPRRSWALLACALGAVLGALYGVTATNCYFPHYYVLGESGVVFVLIVGVAALGGRLARGQPGVRLWARCVFLLTMAPPLWPQVEAAKGLALQDPAPFADPVPGVLAFIRSHTSPSDRIFTTGQVGLYVATNRRPATQGTPIVDELLPAMPGSTDSEKLAFLRDQLAAHPPKIVFLDPELQGAIRVTPDRKRRHMAAVITPFLSAHGYVKASEYLYVRP